VILRPCIAGTKARRTVSTSGSSGIGCPFLPVATQQAKKIDLDDKTLLHLVFRSRLL
jgi:hypothetical protein